ncbi:hypothetical protein RB195_007047 [Necator americanus]|uniref:Uncharacterized protein n=1 Tax=Necator americanus TaxID=51031 RepID=A0ABR1BY91_NECAM
MFCYADYDDNYIAPRLLCNSDEWIDSVQTLAEGREDWRALFKDGTPRRRCRLSRQTMTSTHRLIQAVFLSKTIQNDEDTISFTYRFKVPGQRLRRPSIDKSIPHELEVMCQEEYPKALEPTSSMTSLRSRVFDPNFDYLDPLWMAHCDEIIKRTERLNDRVRVRYGIEPEEIVEDNDLRPRFLRTSDTSGSETAGSGRRLLRVPYTPFPGKTDRATRDAARVIIRSLANPHLIDEEKYRVTSTISAIAGQGLAFNPIRLVRSEPQVSRASSIVCTTDLVATRACSSASCLASNLVSLTHTSLTSSSGSYARQSARSSSAHSRITPHDGRSSPTLSDIVRFRNRIGILSDFLRNPRHRPPKPVIRSNSDASTQQPEGASSNSD